jgi:sterol 3beta-glucosyltransferase
MEPKMKTIVLTTVGTTGDVIPYLALARELKQRGYGVRVTSHAIHRERFERSEIEFVSIGAPFTLADFNTLLDETARIKEPLKQFELMVKRVFVHEAERQLRDQLAAMQDAALVVAHRFDYLGQEAAIKCNLPWASVSLMPQVIRTKEAPVYPSPNLGKWWTEFTWNGLTALSAPLNQYISDVLRNAGCPRRALGIAGALSPLLNIIAASPSLIHVRGDWPANVKVTGAWFAEEPNFQPEPALAEFLAKYPAPVVVTFGSMGGSSAAESERLILDAFGRLKLPAIVQGGYSGLGNNVAGDHIFSAGFVPHDFLFARAGCVVHHAGAGTSTATCKAGVPSVTVPHLFDQYYWGGMLHERGVAPRPLFRNQLSGRKLAGRIEEALSAKVKSAAEEIGKKVRAEQGIENALYLVEQIIGPAA